MRLRPCRPAAALDTATALARLCHDARSPINAILGFCDIMLAERFGPIGTDRYREYLRDVRQSGAQVMSLLADAAELAEIMAGTSRLSPVRISLNEVVNRLRGRGSRGPPARRASSSAPPCRPGLPPILADAEAVRVDDRQPARSCAPDHPGRAGR